MWLYILLSRVHLQTFPFWSYRKGGNGNGNGWIHGWQPTDSKLQCTSSFSSALGFLFFVLADCVWVGRSGRKKAVDDCALFILRGSSVSFERPSRTARTATARCARLFYFPRQLITGGRGKTFPGVMLSQLWGIQDGTD